MLKFRRVSGAACIAALAAGLFLFGTAHAGGQGVENRVAVEAGNQNWDIVAPDMDAPVGASFVSFVNQNWD
ncbi:hypothetical protein ABZ766_00360 [Streptomyces sp. NPDC006670]|uniref:hypothetical protein n=1 Tax=Streptomyces sp. NPDC006670 TaxID=3154476 RepID=UPI0033C1E083